MMQGSEAAGLAHASIFTEGSARSGATAQVF